MLSPGQQWRAEYVTYETGVVQCLRHWVEDLPEPEHWAPWTSALASNA